ncbi:MAG: hypothetical protein NTX25_04415 [Proteobacteria bacterium]|nr:hypothetical protein [Pseudomonadota bacterium]
MRYSMYFIFCLCLNLACHETGTISSSEVGGLKSASNFEVTDAEAEQLMKVITQKIERGEDLSASLTHIIQIVITRKGPDYKWQKITLDNDRTNRLQAKFSRYKALYQKSLDRYGFVEGCDGLLFTSLLVLAGLDHQYGLAESLQEPGRWYRSADHNCFPSGKSKSSISRDMLLGLSLALWQKSDGGSVARILSFSEKNRGKLGDAIDANELAGAATMSPSLLSLLSEINFRINGQNSQNRGYFPELGKNFQGFEAHLLVLRLILKSALYGGLLKSDFQILETLAKVQTKNALFQLVLHALTDANGSSAADILLNTEYFPESSLPSSAQHCEPYLWQRDQFSNDWQACPSQSIVFPAVDYFVVYGLLINGLRQ